MGACSHAQGSRSLQVLQWNVFVFHCVTLRLQCLTFHLPKVHELIVLLLAEVRKERDNELDSFDLMLHNIILIFLLFQINHPEKSTVECQAIVVLMWCPPDLVKFEDLQ